MMTTLPRRAFRLVNFSPWTCSETTISGAMSPSFGAAHAWSGRARSAAATAAVRAKRIQSLLLGRRGRRRERLDPVLALLRELRPDAPVRALLVEGDRLLLVALLLGRLGRVVVLLERHDPGRVRVLVLGQARDLLLGGLDDVVGRRPVLHDVVERVLGGHVVLDAQELVHVLELGLPEVVDPLRERLRVVAVRCRLLLELLERAARGPEVARLELLQDGVELLRVVALRDLVD